MVVVIVLQVEVNSGGNVYFCFCSGHGSREPDEGGSLSSEGSPERCHAHAWDERGWHTSMSASGLQIDCEGGRGGEDSCCAPESAVPQRRAASDDSTVRQLVDVLQAAADDGASAGDGPAASTPPSGSRNGAAGGHSNIMQPIGSPGPPRGLPSPPSTAAAARLPDSRAEGRGDGGPQQASALQQSCQQELAQSQPQHDGQISQDGSSSQTAEREGSDTVQASQPAHAGSGQSQPPTLQREHSGSAPASPDHQHPPDRLLVVKFLPARLDAQSEQFASELARHLGVPSPACRILRKQVAQAALCCWTTADRNSRHEIVRWAWSVLSAVTPVVVVFQSVVKLSG